MECLMPSLAPDQLTYDLHETNGRLNVLLDSLSPAPAQPGARLRPATPRQMAILLSELMRAGQWLRSLPDTRDAALEQELGQYHKVVERLRDLLPSIHCALLEERARLERERDRVRSASEWARGSRQTL
jgi:hypothetical protein